MSPASVPPEHRGSGFRQACAVIAVLCCTVGVAAVVFVETQMVRSDIVRSYTQPPGIEYDGATYHAGLMRHESWLLRRRLPDSVEVSRDPDFSYGHTVDFEITGPRDPELSTVSWQPHGVGFRFGSGHEIFLPVSAFTGGR